MKGPLDRTKVVLRQLPPAITQAMLMEQIDTAFAGRYNWVSFRPGKISQNHQSCSRAYIDFMRPEDVVDFAAFFNGHVFVNEKGAQYKTLVEYAPSQRVPKQWSKKDGREGSIHKDPEYLEFLESISKPVENLPSAEIQLERREAERAGAPKEAPIVTPLMDFVRQKRAAKAGPRRILSNGKLSRRAGGSSGGTPGSASSKRLSEKKRTSTTMYVLRESAKNTGGKDKSAYVLASKRDDQKISDKSAASASASGSEVLEGESGASGNLDSGKKKIVLLKGRSQEVANVSDSMSRPYNVASSARITLTSPALKQNQRREGSGRIIRGILLNKEARQSQASLHQSDHQIQNSNFDKEKRPPRPPHTQSDAKDANGVLDDKVVIDTHGFREKQERRTRNKDRPDRGVWTLRRSDGSYASDELFSSSGSQPSLSVGDSQDGIHGDVKIDMATVRSGEVRTVGSGRNSYPSQDNGSHRHVRRGMVHGIKDADGYYDGKPLRRGASSGHGSHEKQVWVQKSSSGS